MSETYAQRATRKRAERAGLTEEQLRANEDEAFVTTAYVIRSKAERLRSDDERQDRTAKATAAVRAKGDAHRRRAADLRDEGLSAPRIGIRMAQEEKRAEPYSERQVRKWLAPRKG